MLQLPLPLFAQLLLVLSTLLIFLLCHIHGIFVAAALAPALWADISMMRRHTLNSGSTRWKQHRQEAPNCCTPLHTLRASVWHRTNPKERSCCLAGALRYPRSLSCTVHAGHLLQGKAGNNFNTLPPEYKDISNGLFSIDLVNKRRVNGSYGPTTTGTQQVLRRSSGWLLLGGPLHKMPCHSSSILTEQNICGIVECITTLCIDA